MSLRIDPQSPVGSRLIRLAAWLIRVILATLGRTYRVRVIEGGQFLEDWSDHRHPTILSFWHNRAFIGAHYVYHHLVERNLKISVLTSQSRDGELVARVAQQWGLSVVRGSASRGGLQALRALHRAITRDGFSPIMIPDGPRGPIYHFKVGVAVLAQTSGAPILPMGLAAQRFFTIKSWDRLIIPWPFSRVVIGFGEPQTLAKPMTNDQLEAARRRLEATVDGLTLRAEAELGAVDDSRPHETTRAGER